ncbi:MAG: hypothetical protein ACI9OD_004521 [Limisphaerales bacterium]|jgi:hypothetical protein
MLRRQPAEAIIAARKQIVHGAVSMVDQALKELAEKSVDVFRRRSGECERLDRVRAHPGGQAVATKGKGPSRMTDTGQSYRGRFQFPDPVLTI